MWMQVVSGGAWFQKHQWVIGRQPIKGASSSQLFLRLWPTWDFWEIAKNIPQFPLPRGKEIRVYVHQLPIWYWGMFSQASTAWYVVRCPPTSRRTLSRGQQGMKWAAFSTQESVLRGWVGARCGYCSFSVFVFRITGSTGIVGWSVFLQRQVLKGRG